MAESGKLHSNWRALSTVQIPFKIFVTGEQSADTSSELSTLENPQEIHHHQSGEEIKEFYEEIISTVHSNLNKTRNRNLSSLNQEEFTLKNEISISKKLQFTKNKFFLAAMTNNLEILKNFDIFSTNLSQNRTELINSCDEFGWTALMMAACENSKDTFEYLLKNGADLSICDKKGNTAYSLAVQKKHYDIIRIIHNENEKHKTKRNHTNANHQNDSNRKKRRNSNFYCVECKTEFKESSRNKHETSTIHQFNLKRFVDEKDKRFANISINNRGLKLMLKQGWDKKSGLGPLSKGNLYPVKTVIRKQRSGLGIEQDNKPKITHFRPNDVAAIQYKLRPPPDKVKNRKELRKQNKIDKFKEKYLREELS